MPTDYTPEPDGDGFSVSLPDLGELKVIADPIFDSNQRLGFASVRCFREKSLIFPHRFNLDNAQQRSRYLAALLDREVNLPEGVLIALSVVVRDAQRSVVSKGKPQSAVVESLSRDEPSQEELATLAGELLRCTDLVEHVGQVMTLRGYAGATQPAQLVYVAIVSRSLQRPLNAAVVSESASGKNATIDAARALHPPEAVHEIKAGSSKAIIYTDVDYQHRVVLFAESDSIPDDGPGASAIRSLAADNYLAYDVVEQDPETKKWTTRHIVKPGPTGLLTTSTRSLTHQLNTRVLELGVPDDAAQTREVMRAHAHRVQPAQAEPPEIEPWHALGRYVAIRAQDLVGIHIPFADALAALLPARAVRMRRDFRQLLTVIEACALLHVIHREISDGWLKATLEQDYCTARELLAPLFDTLAADGLTPPVRAVVAAVKPAEQDVSVGELAKRLGISPSTASWRVTRALRGGWLVDDAPPRSRARRLRHGEPLPDDTSVLPSVEQINDWNKQRCNESESSRSAPSRNGKTPSDERLNDSTSPLRDTDRHTTPASVAPGQVEW